MGNKEHYMKKKKKEFLVVSHPLSLADLKICSSSSEGRVPNKNGLMPEPSTLTCADGITSSHFSLIIIKPPSSLPSHPPETIMTDQSGTSMFIWIKMYKHPPVPTRCNLCRGCQRGIRVETIGPFLRCMR